MATVTIVSPAMEGNDHVFVTAISPPTAGIAPKSSASRRPRSSAGV